MTTKLKLLSVLAFLNLALGCNSQTPLKVGSLTKEEKFLCDSLQIDSSIVKDIRKFNQNKIEAFHYSLSKIVTKDSEIEADPIFLQGIVLQESNSKSYDLVFSLKDELRKKGYSIFVLENHFGFDEKADNIGVLKTADKYAVLKQIQTDGINYSITNDSLISIIKQFDKKYSLELVGASGDWCDFVIHKEPKDWMQFAKEVYKVCPDVVDQGTGTLQVLADEMKRTKRLYFWWD
ncbi:DUF4253 domain-containing protein [Pinibacter aurantiacus]|uniref:DUF4253 domain-containing protein n=1 Tax=Pinibacter aurantiacus TaxID=2851599 RepID=A0A9E2SFN3_9BACT|nr:DUF4253 domain-containing protein [Pinibacter aurantiacus]MBV4360658.1 DUF4253 domain-containing protein [Pinibacter aurantiacus]